jgi:LysM repeat protein
VSTAQPAEQPLLVTPHGGPASDSASGATTISNPAPRAIIVEPAAPTDATTATSHTVVSGDTLWRIASKYKVTTDALMKANGIDDPKKLRLGMTLKVPAAN